MTIEILRQGLVLNNKINELKRQLDGIKEYLSNNNTIGLNVAGMDIQVPKAFINAKISTRVSDLQAEIDTLQAQFDNL